MADRRDNTFSVKVVTPYQNFYEGMAVSLVLPTTDGDIGFMAGHVPMVVALKPGIAAVRCGEEVKHFTVSEGFAEISSDEIIVVCNSAEYPEDIKIVRMCKSYKDNQADMEKARAIEDKEARTAALKELNQELGRFKARRHIIELYGSAEKKEKLALHLNEYGIS